MDSRARFSTAVAYPKRDTLVHISFFSLHYSYMPFSSRSVRNILKRTVSIFLAWAVILCSLGVSSTALAANNAAFVSQSVPARMVMGRTYYVSITMRNSGTTPWLATGPSAFSLAARNPVGNTWWAGGRVNLGNDVAAGTNITFGFHVTAPTTAGTYNFQWQMQSVGVGFGATTTNVAMVVGPELPGAILTSPVSATSLTASGTSATLRVTGTSSPNYISAVKSFSLLDNDKVIYTSTDKTTLDTTVTLTSGMVHRLRLRTTATASFNGTGGDVEGFSPEVPVTVNSTAPIANCQALTPPSGNIAITRATGAVYGNNASGYKVGSDIGRALLHAGLLTPGAQAYVTVTPLGQVAGFTGTTANGVTTSDAETGCGMRLAVSQIQQRLSVTISEPETDTGMLIADTATGRNVQITASAYDPDENGISRMVLMEGDTILSMEKGDFFDYKVPLSPGRHVLKMMAYGATGKVAESKPVVVVISYRTPGDDAKFVAQNAPVKLRPGEPYDATVSMLNTGTNGWSTDHYRLGAANPHGNSTWLSGGRSALPSFTGSGGVTHVTLPLTAPLQPGIYNFQWQMVKDEDAWFGEISPNQLVMVEDGPGPTATLTVTPPSAQIVDGGSTTLNLSGSAVSTGGQVNKLELMVDSGKGFGLVQTYTFGAGKSPEFSLNRNYNRGTYRFKLRATDINGVKADSDVVTVNVTVTKMLGEFRGVRTGASGHAELFGWACVPGVKTPLNYQVLLDSPFPNGGATLLTTGVANVSTEWNNESIQYKCGQYDGSAPHHFVVPLDSYAAQYMGRKLFVLVSSPEEALRKTPAKKGVDRDEYPPALFKQGGQGASVRYINPSDNRGAGACIGAQCRGLPDGADIKIEVRE